jgi:hypothetical protein
VNFGNYSPPAAPSRDQQRDALRKGQGRAMQWALAGRLDDQPLLDACLCDQRFDTQVEDMRGAWLWGLMQATGNANRFRVPILHALHELADDRSIAQLCQLARHYAETGDHALRSRLYEIVEQRPVATSPELGEEDIVMLDGAEGFLHAARVRGTSLTNRDSEWDDGALIDFAGQRLGQEQVERLLQASSDKAVQGFHDRWRQAQQSRTKPPSRAEYREQMRAIPVQEVLRAADSDTARGWFIGWGMHADEPDLRTVLVHLWSAPQGRVQRNLLRLFTRRSLPEFDAKLIDQCRHGDDETRARAFRALRQNPDPLVRQFVYSLALARPAPAGWPPGHGISGAATPVATKGQRPRRNAPKESVAENGCKYPSLTNATDH